MDYRCGIYKTGLYCMCLSQRCSLCGDCTIMHSCKYSANTLMHRARACCLTQQKRNSPVQDWNSDLYYLWFLLPIAAQGHHRDHPDITLSGVDSTPPGKWTARVHGDIIIHSSWLLWIQLPAWAQLVSCGGPRDCANLIVIPLCLSRTYGCIIAKWKIRLITMQCGVKIWANVYVKCLKLCRALSPCISKSGGKNVFCLPIQYPILRMMYLSTEH